MNNNSTPETTTPDNFKLTSTDHVIRARKTWKILANSSTQDGDEQADVAKSKAKRDLHQLKVQTAIESAGWAPFHYDRRQDDLAEPWRFYWLDESSCRGLGRDLSKLSDTMKPGNKLPRMLEACHSLVIVTWLPESLPVGDNEATDLARIEKLKLVNEEHLAAASAAVQNLLLSLESHSLGTYWSSGGTLRDKPVYDALGINFAERLLAAVFIQDPGLAQLETEKIPGKLREKRSSWRSWCRNVRYHRTATE